MASVEYAQAPASDGDAYSIADRSVRSQDAAKQTLYNNIIGSITLEDEIVLEPVTYDKVDDMAQYLILLAVHPDYQNRMNGRLETGVGSSLLQDHLSTLGDEGISTDCSASNVSAFIPLRYLLIRLRLRHDLCSLYPHGLSSRIENRIKSDGAADCADIQLSWYTRHGFRPIWTGKHGGRTPAGDEHSWRQFRMYYGPSADQSAGQG